MNHIVHHISVSNLKSCPQSFFSTKSLELTEANWKPAQQTKAVLITN